MTCAPAFDVFQRPSRYKAAFGGRGSGKSHFFAEALVANACNSKGLSAVCVREVLKDLKDSAKRLIEAKIASMGVSNQFTVLNNEIRTPGNGLIIFKGMQDYTADSIKSLEGFHVAWVEEAHTLSKRSLELLRPTIRAERSEIWFSWNPRSASDPVDEFFRGPTPPADAIIERINYDKNTHFPDVLEKERQADEANNRLRYGHIWLGDYEPMAVGAIWDRATIHTNRRAFTDVPTLDMVVVGCDPAMTSNDDSDEYGVIVSGKASDGRGYVLDDVSGVYTPHQWAVQTCAAYDQWEADAVIIEDNQGGEHVENTIHAVRPDVRVIRVHVSRRKPDRAKPISALYATGKVSHVGTFQKLEDQMCLMTSTDYEGEGSPDRVDGLVLGMTHIFPSLTRKTAKKTHVEPLGAGSWMA